MCGARGVSRNSIRINNLHHKRVIYAGICLPHQLGSWAAKPSIVATEQTQKSPPPLAGWWAQGVIRLIGGTALHHQNSPAGSACVSQL